MQKRDAKCICMHRGKEIKNQIHIQEAAPHVQLLHIHVAAMLQLLQELHTHRYTPADVPIDNPTSLGPAAVPNLL